MEWIETTGRSVDEAKDAALDRLGVDESDAEFEVLAEAQTGLFGRLRSEARVRARVRPTVPRAKDDRRDRRRRSRENRPGGSEPAGTAPAAPVSTTEERPVDASASRDGARRRRRKRRRGGGRGGEGVQGGDPAVAATGADGPAPSTAASAAKQSARSANRTGASSSARSGGAALRGSSNGGSRETTDGDPFDYASESRDEKGVGVEVALERQAEIAVDFVSGLATTFGLDAAVEVLRPDDETVEIRLNGPDLGLLIGPKGSTLVAIQNLARTVVFNHTGATNGHVNVDVGGYRQKRTEALVRFATQVAEKAKQTGERIALEPMSAVDRKVVHDTIAGIEGVSTISEGEEPRRRVVVLPG